MINRALFIFGVTLLFGGSVRGQNRSEQTTDKYTPVTLNEKRGTSNFTQKNEVALKKMEPVKARQVNHQSDDLKEVTTEPRKKVVTKPNKLQPVK